MKILAIGASLREKSFNKMVAKVAAKGAEQAGAEVHYVDLADYPLPLFNEDLETNEGFPERAKALQDLFIGCDGFLISCPEYNSMMPAVLKNAIDWISRKQEGQARLQAFAGKKAVIMSASPGALGGIRGLPILRLLLANLGVNVLAKQKAVGGVAGKFDAEGHITDDALKAELEDLGRALVKA